MYRPRPVWRGAPAGESYNDLNYLCKIVDEGESAEEVRWILENLPRRRPVLANSPASYVARALKSAHQANRGDLVGALLEAGADASLLPPEGRWTALGLCARYGQADSLSVLLRAGHDPDEKSEFVLEPAAAAAANITEETFCRPAHVAVITPAAAPNPRLRCLEVLLREGGADANARDATGGTPLYWLPYAASEDQEPALELLLSSGGDLNARDKWGATPLFYAADHKNAELALLMLARGASADVIDLDGRTALIYACENCPPDGSAAQLVSALLRASSPETRRAVELETGASALDYFLASIEADEPLKPWQEQTTLELLRAGVPANPEHAARVLPIAARLGTRLEADMHAQGLSLPYSWRVYEAMVNLAFDFKEARAVDSAVEATERRVEELEAELRALGVGTEDTEDEEEEDEEEEEEEDEEEGSSSKGNDGDGQTGAATGRKEEAEEDAGGEPGEGASTSAAAAAAALSGLRI